MCPTLICIYLSRFFHTRRDCGVFSVEEFDEIVLIMQELEGSLLKGDMREDEVQYTSGSLSFGLKHWIINLISTRRASIWMQELVIW